MLGQLALLGYCANSWASCVSLQAPHGHAATLGQSLRCAMPAQDFHYVKRGERGWIWVPVWPHTHWHCAQNSTSIFASIEVSAVAGTCVRIWGSVSRADMTKPLQDRLFGMLKKNRGAGVGFPDLTESELKSEFHSSTFPLRQFSK